ncbi:hypothetical protein [Desulfosporosinus acidiphilus]|uniref:hypothetical protein n=1 Tax=Desulfosporosinus acidiphilus TaxID=885581 RepID=UPI000314EC10|nr:hypothetical protein [Desulfosporosinus acidiphilus]
MAVFLFSLGFAVLYGLYEEALAETHQSAYLLGAANLAQKRLDQLAARSWKDNINQRVCLPGETVEGDEGTFHWLIYSNWDHVPQLLRVKVEVRWVDRGSPENYQIESLFQVE